MTLVLVPEELLKLA